MTARKAPPWARCRPFLRRKSAVELCSLPGLVRGQLKSRDETMRKYLVAAILIAAFASPALAEEFYVGYDGKRCEMFSHKPGDKMNLIGTFKSKHDAEKAMKEMKQCNKG